MTTSPLDKASVQARLTDPATRDTALIEVGMWVLNTCLMVGTEPATAFQVAGTFVHGVQDSYLPPRTILNQYQSRPGGRGRYERKKHTSRD